MPATPEQWAAARQKYETSPTTGAALAKELGVSGAAVTKMAQRQGWVKFDARVKVKAKQVKLTEVPSVNQESAKVVPLTRRGKPLKKTGEQIRALVQESKRQSREYVATHNPQKWKAWIADDTNAVAEFGITTFHRWIAADPLRMDEYARAKKGRADVLFDTLLGMAAKAPERGPDGKIDPGWVQWQRLIVDTAKWGVAKLRPEAYGDRTDLHVTGNITATVDREQIAQELRSLMAKGMQPRMIQDVTDVQPKE